MIPQSKIECVINNTKSISISNLPKLTNFTKVMIPGTPGISGTVCARNNGLHKQRH